MWTFYYWFYSDKTRRSSFTRYKASSRTLRADFRYSHSLHSLPLSPLIILGCSRTAVVRPALPKPEPSGGGDGWGGRPSEQRITAQLKIPRPPAADDRRPARGGGRLGWPAAQAHLGSSWGTYTLTCPLHWIICLQSKRLLPYSAQQLSKAIEVFFHRLTVNYVRRFITQWYWQFRAKTRSFH